MCRRSAALRGGAGLAGGLSGVLGLPGQRLAHLGSGRRGALRRPSAPTITAAAGPAPAAAPPPPAAAPPLAAVEDAGAEVDAGADEEAAVVDDGVEDPPDGADDSPGGAVDLGLPNTFAGPSPVGGVGTGTGRLMAFLASCSAPIWLYRSTPTKLRNR